MTTKKAKVGLCWCGGSFDPRRAMHLSDLEPLIRVPEVSFFQLQRGAALKACTKRHTTMSEKPE